MFRSYDHLQAEIYIKCLEFQDKVQKSSDSDKLVTWNFFIFPLEDGYKTETCSGY
jgi:hypothetical protein